MDIDLLSKIVKEIILDKDEVSLPGVGSFVAEIVPSVFSDKGYTINPPYKRLYFRQKENPQDTSLVDFYAASNKLEPKMASEILTDFLKELRQILETRKNIIFPGLGRLRATKENYFFFVADENLDIYPEGFGLEPISLKTHEETTSEVSRTMATLKSILSPEEDDTAVSAEDNAPQTEQEMAHDAQESVTVQETEPAAPEEVKAEELQEKQEEAAETSEETVQETEEENNHESAPAENPETDAAEASGTTASAEPQKTAVQEPAPEEQLPEEAQAPEEGSEPEAQPMPEAEQSAPEQKKKSIRKTIGWTAIIILALTLTALAAFIFLAHVAPDFIDSILYTPEELEIINR